jgi:hypothetical protein
MKTKTKPAPYVAPQCEMESHWLPGIICSSPAEGENEAIEYEDWKDLVS